VSAAGIIQAAALLAILTALTPPLGRYVAWVFRRPPRGLERRLLTLLRVDLTDEQDWKAYARSMLVFSALCFAALYVLLRTQGLHPFNPEGFHSGTWDVSFNTAASFVSNTSWQFYAGETTLSYFSQMAGIAVHSFLSAAVGLATAIAVIRGFAARSGTAIGNFWVDLTRALLFVLLPIALVATLLLVSQGVIQSLAPYKTITTVAGDDQTLAFGPVASQVAIKTMGSVGGGFFNVNSAMPFENATALASFVQALLIVLVPAGLTATFGRYVGSRRQGWVLFAVMLGLFAVSIAAVSLAESDSTPAMSAAGVHGDNLEGKEVRFGAAGTGIYAASTTAGASGAVNGAMESFSGLGSAVPMANMMTGELVFGGIGSGLSGMLLMVLVAVFLAGLMVGRTPAYLGKKIKGPELRSRCSPPSRCPPSPLRRSRSRWRPTTAARRCFHRARSGSRRASMRTSRRP
jgi:potassium-transporting ATPase potassium-binding subunit